MGKGALYVLKFFLSWLLPRRDRHPTLVVVFGSITLNQDIASSAWPRKRANAVFSRTENHIRVSRGAADILKGLIRRD